MGKSEITDAKRIRHASVDQRKAILLDAAIGMFFRHGYAETSLVQIAARARMATQTLYEEFCDKETIFHEAIRAFSVAATIPVPEIELDETLFSVLYRVAEMSLSHEFAERSVDLKRILIAESRRFPEFTRAIAAERITCFKSDIASIFYKMDKSGQIPSMDHIETANLFVDLLFGGSATLCYADSKIAQLNTGTITLKVEFFIKGRFC